MSSVSPFSGVSAIGNDIYNFLKSLKDDAKTAGTKSAQAATVKPGTSPFGCHTTGADKPTDVVPTLVDGGGIQLQQPDAPLPPVIPDGGTDAPPTSVIIDDAGTVVTHTDSGTTITYPKDANGNYILTSGAFTLNWDGNLVWTTPDAYFNSGVIAGQGLRDLDLWVEISTDSTKLANMPVQGCFGGLINIFQVTPGDGCPTDAYNTFYNCPDEDANRIQFYLGGWSLAGTNSSGDAITVDPADTNYPTSLVYDTAVLLTDPTVAPEVGVSCGDEPNPYAIKLSPNFNQEDYVNFGLSGMKFAIVRDDLTSKGDMAPYYQTVFNVVLKGKPRV
jgi:hypothetical protein